MSIPVVFSRVLVCAAALVVSGCGMMHPDESPLFTYDMRKACERRRSACEADGGADCEACE